MGRWRIRSHCHCEPEALHRMVFRAKGAVFKLSTDYILELKMTLLIFRFSEEAFRFKKVFNVLFVFYVRFSDSLKAY